MLTSDPRAWWQPLITPSQAVFPISFPFLWEHRLDLLWCEPLQTKQGSPLSVGLLEKLKQVGKRVRGSGKHWEWSLPTFFQKIVTCTQAILSSQILHLQSLAQASHCPSESLSLIFSDAMHSNIARYSTGLHLERYNTLLSKYSRKQGKEKKKRFAVSKLLWSQRHVKGIPVSPLS